MGSPVFRFRGTKSFLKRVFEMRKRDTAGAVCPKHVSLSDNHLLPVEQIQVRSPPRVLRAGLR